MSELHLYNEGLVDDLMADFLDAVKAKLAERGVRMWVSVGVDDNPDHGGTHLGAGVVDLHGSTRTHQDMLITDEVWRSLGGWGWYRDKEHGGFVQHYHGGLIDHPSLSATAKRQQAAYMAGFNGLGPSVDFRRAPDYGPRQYLDRRFNGAKPVTAAADGWTHRTSGYAANDPLNIRSGAGMKFSVITTVAAGARLRIVGYGPDRWVKAQFEGGTVGWIWNQYITRIGG